MNRFVHNALGDWARFTQLWNINMRGSGLFLLFRCGYFTSKLMVRDRRSLKIKLEVDERAWTMTERQIMTFTLILKRFHLPLRYYMFINPSGIFSCSHVVKTPSPKRKCKKMFTVSPAELKSKSDLFSAPVGPGGALSQVIHSKWKQEGAAKCSGMVRTHFRVCAVIRVWMCVFPHQNMTTRCSLHLL